MVDIDPEFENLYMPSNWVVRVPVEESVPLHVKVSHTLLTIARSYSDMNYFDQ